MSRPHAQIRSTLVTVVVGVVLATSAPPATAAADATSSIDVESDPSTFLFGGFSAHLRLAPSSQQWMVGLGVYALDLPRAMVDLVPANRGEGWDVRLRLGYGLFVDRMLGARQAGQRHEGALVGVQIAAQHLRIRNEQLGSTSASSMNWLIMPRIGYLFRPFDAGLYLLGWLGVGATGRLSGDTRVGADSYQVFPVIAFAALHLGWSF